MRTFDGIEYDIHAYLTSDEGIEAVYSAKGARALPSEETIAIFGEKAIKGMPPGLGNWRLMTLEEIQDYKKRQENEANQSNNEDDFDD